MAAESSAMIRDVRHQDEKQGDVKMSNDNIGKMSVEFHRKNKGKLGVISKVDCKSSEGLSLAYTPGVAEVCREIVKNPDSVYEMTCKWNTVAVVSDGTRVLGLGNIGPVAGLPVMEGKAVLFKSYGAIDAFPICLACKNEEEIVQTVKNISPSFGGINLEDIESPKCFSVEKRLIEELNIPVFHDDQHGTAVVALAGLINALKLVKKGKNAKIVVSGAGAAGVAIVKLLYSAGFSDIIVCDSSGIIVDSKKLPLYKREIAKITNRKGARGNLSDALEGADVFIGVSAPNIIGAKDVMRMAKKAVVFALSNPIPEIAPDEAKRAGVAIFGTARSDLPNQVNNVLGFPGIFRGALLVRAKKISEGMKLAAVYALAGCIPESELKNERILPLPFEKGVARKVATAVALEAQRTGDARLKMDEAEIAIELAKLGID